MRDPAGYRPADIAARIASNEVLRRYAYRVCNIERFVHGLGDLELEYFQIDGFSVVRNPADSDVAIWIVNLFKNGAPYCLPNFEWNRATVLDIDVFAMHDERQFTVGGPVRIGRRPRLQQNGIGPVAITIRKSPGNLAVTSGDNKWSARQSDTCDIPSFAGINDEPCPVVDIRRGQSQVHIVGNDRPSGAGQRAADGPIVAAVEIWLADLVGRWCVGRDITYGVVV